MDAQPSAGYPTATHRRTIGPYVPIRRLGEGGMGIVYLARDPEGRQVALKVMRPELAALEEFRARFRKEAEAAKRVARFCTAPLLDAGLDGDRHYLVTEYVDGPDLSSVIDAQGPLRKDDACLCSKLPAEHLKQGDVLPLYATYTGVSEDLETVAVEAPGLGLFADLPVSS
ncbi:hypothetical protein GCM10010116_38120 [Microbispora rosea subsp. aerata]|nr:hypothetical protein [Microbispora rosea]GGO18933.1 hypothetical protein GCM10010116_38120 [Microbispora rosea subsp. aerata]GIH54290.1 hypothetical protein Mro02_12040 [Microbispora rosea subsp. aerata]GLJ81531.1 hypothetical protein GCM10017588_02550 [Microbispora rosea subsp. aerata]